MDSMIVVNNNYDNQGSSVHAFACFFFTTTENMLSERQICFITIVIKI